MARDMIETEEVFIDADKNPKTAQERTRRLWITELRRQGHRQCYGELFYFGHVCALGLLAEVAGLSSEDAYHDIGESAGLDGDQLQLVWRMNDGDREFGPPLQKHTFAEIADVVEGWFK